MFLPLVSTILINILLIIIWNTVQNSPKMTRITHIRDPRTITDRFWTRPESWSDFRKVGPCRTNQRPARTMAPYHSNFRPDWTGTCRKLNQGPRPDNYLNLGPDYDPKIFENRTDLDRPLNGAGDL